MQLHKTLNATLHDVSSFTAQLEATLAELNINDRTTVVLGIQELLVNIVQHGYAGVVGQIDFDMDLSDGRIVFQVHDNSETLFSLMDYVDIPDPLGLPENGMGLFIIRQAFDEVTHERSTNVNHWHLMKKLETNIP